MSRKNMLLLAAIAAVVLWVRSRKKPLAPPPGLFTPP